MTTNTIEPIAEFLEDGVTTVHPIPFKFLANGDLVVERIVAGAATVLTLDTEYDASGALDPSGGSLIKADGGTAGATLRITRFTSREQGMDYTPNDTFPAESHEEALDRQSLINQEQDVAIANIRERVVMVPEGSEGFEFVISDLLENDLLQFRGGKIQRLQREAFAGKYYAGGAGGVMVPASGTGGGDAALRSDLATTAGEDMIGADDGAAGAKWDSLAGFIAYLRSSAGSSLPGFLPEGLTASLRSVEDKLRDDPALADFGAVGDGALHTVAEWIIPGIYGRYASLAAVQVDYPHVAAASDCLNWAAMQKAHDWAVDNGRRRVTGRGRIKFQTTVALADFGITFAGPKGGRAVGSETLDLELVWGGGAFPMFTVAATRYRFSDMLIVNEGLATNFLRLDSGAQGVDLEQVHCQTSGHTSFSEAFVKSNGNRLGDSVVRNCLIGSVAPILFFIDGQGTANSITGIRFEGENVFTAETQDITVLHIKDETVERVIMRDQRFLQKNGFQCLSIDTTDTPAAITINTLVMDACEFEAAGTDAAGIRFGKLTNVQSLRFNGCKIDGGGTKDYGFDLVGTHVTDCNGNYFNSLSTALFNCDATSTVRHGKQAFSQRPVFTTKTAGIHKPTYGASIQIDGRSFSQEKTEIVEIDVADGAGFTISMDTSSPQYIAIGQVFVLRLRNVSGGATSAGTPGANLVLAGAAFAAAPADGFHRDYLMTWDGAKAHEVVRGAGDLAN